MDVTLRKFSGDWYQSHLIRVWRNQNREYFPEQDLWTTEGVMKWYNDVYRDDPADNYFLVLADGTPCGTIAFNSKTWEIGRVLLGGKRFARQGVMSQALTLLMESFDQEWYWLKVLRNNEDAIAFYRRNHFQDFRNSYKPEGDGEWLYMRRYNE